MIYREQKEKIIKNQLFDIIKNGMFSSYLDYDKDIKNRSTDS